MSWKAVQGRRINRTFSALSDPMIGATTMVVYLMLAPLRFIAKFLQRSTRVARINRGPCRPPVLDATNCCRSSFTFACQFYSALLSVDGGFRPVVKTTIDELVRSAELRGFPAARARVLLDLRKGAVG